MKIVYVRFEIVAGYCRSGIPTKNFESNEAVFGGNESKFAALVLSQNIPETVEERVGERSRDKTAVVSKAHVEIVPDISSAMIIKLSKEEVEDERTLLIVDPGRDIGSGWTEPSKGDPKQIFKSKQISIWIMEPGEEVTIHETYRGYRYGRVVKIEARE